jgi:hypothetical protein
MDDDGRTHEAPDVEAVESASTVEAPAAAESSRAYALVTRGAAASLGRHLLRRKLLRRAARNDNGVAAGAERAVDAAASSSGAPLPAELQRKFERSLGADLSAVRVHAGSDSATAAEAVSAKAYTVGNEIHFAAGQYRPDDAEGAHLLAHEVAHTVQQSGGAPPTPMFKLEVSTPGDAHELEADRAADAMVSGHSFAVGGSGHGIAREEAEAPEGGGSASVGVSKNSVKVSAKYALPPEKFPIGKWGEGELGLEGSAEGSLEKIESEGKEGGKEGGGEKKEGGGHEKQEGGETADAEHFRGEAEKAGVEELKKLAASKKEEGKSLLELEPEGPEIEVGKEGGKPSAELTAVTLKVKTKGGEVASFKVSLYDLKKGGLEINGPSIKVEVPFAFGESEIWHNQKYKLVASRKITFKGMAKPKWTEIGREILNRYSKELGEQALEKGAQAGGAALTTDTLPVGLAALGAAEIAPIAGGLLICASVVYAWVKSAQQCADLAAAKTEGAKQVDALVNGGLAGLGLGGDAGDGGFQAWSYYSGRLHGAVENLYAKHKDAGVTHKDIENAILDGLRQTSPSAAAQIRQQVAPAVAQQYADAYYNKYAHELVGPSKESLTLEAKAIYAHIGGGSGYTPADKAKTNSYAPTDNQVLHETKDQEMSSDQQAQLRIPTTNGYAEKEHDISWYREQATPGQAIQEANDAYFNPPAKWLNDAYPSWAEGTKQRLAGNQLIAKLKTSDDVNEVKKLGRDAKAAYEAAAEAFKEAKRLQG